MAVSLSLCLTVLCSSLMPGIRPDVGVELCAPVGDHAFPLQFLLCYFFLLFCACCLLPSLSNFLFIWSLYSLFITLICTKSTSLLICLDADVLHKIGRDFFLILESAVCLMVNSLSPHVTWEQGKISKENAKGSSSVLHTSFSVCFDFSLARSFSIPFFLVSPFYFCPKANKYQLTVAMEHTTTHIMP